MSVLPSVSPPRDRTEDGPPFPFCSPLPSPSLSEREFLWREPLFSPLTQPPCLFLSMLLSRRSYYSSRGLRAFLPLPRLSPPPLSYHPVLSITFACLQSCSSWFLSPQESFPPSSPLLRSSPLTGAGMLFLSFFPCSDRFDPMPAGFVLHPSFNGVV